ncbi:peptidase M3 [Dyadobacter luteus]|jgi:peptidyl-dipeptidase Dcp|uniref:Peptidase M3 n=1 Tax=Dyadobacter luteus TaxID=2259619 RepID=A0A3D8Y7P3_9BACT|nr:M3 family metallopeptidase [Dyadobacter luteus]REA58901.1 peptidase M3 [Dyadobacter luteus]
MTSPDNNTKNPLLSPFAETPFQVPPFDKIRTEHFMPAFEKGMKEQSDRIAAIYLQRSAPVFENTIIPLENAGALLNRICSVFFNLNSANTSPDIEQIAQEIAPRLSQHGDDIYMNQDLFHRVKTVFDQQDQHALTGEQKRLLDDTYKSFIRSGANLDEEQQLRMREINQQLSIATVKFGQNLLAETNRYELIIDNKADLTGLPASLISSASQSAKDNGHEGKWRFTLHNPSVMPFLEFAENRTLREQIYKAYINRANQGDESDNNSIVQKIVTLRAERAALLGYTSHADYVLENSMAKNPQRVYELLDQLWEAALPIAKREQSEMEVLMNSEGGNSTLQAWDWFYYADKVRKAKYNYDSEALKPYFKLENVRDGIFAVAQKLYGITFSAITDIPAYHEDVVGYEVKEGDGSHTGVLYLDYFTRKSKRGGAWMTSYRRQSSQDGQRISPVISIVCNFPKPVDSQPVLLTPDEVETFFHEFGHALHGLLSNVTYESQAGTAVPRDFVELPSQIMEHWAFEPDALKLYAKHFQSGEIIPAELVTKMKEASKFNQGFGTVEYLAASLLDMSYHTLKSGETVQPDVFEKEQMEKIGLISQIAPRYRSTYFQHIFSGGYSAGYYSYIWSEVLDSDGFAAFLEKGNIFDQETATSFRKNILEKGDTEDPMTLYKAFRGREPEVSYLLKNRGLDE